MTWQRIRTDFRFAIITLFSAVTVVGIVPFAIYRFANGQVLAGLVDLGIVVSILLAGMYVWRGGDIRRAALVTMLAYIVGCMLVAQLIGLAGVLWMYPVLLANFLMVERRAAVVGSALAITGILVLPGVLVDGMQRAIFLVTTLVVSLFAFIFAYRTDMQRAQLEDVASHDSLTGIHNRRAMEREIAIAIDAWRRHRTPHGLAIVDLDRFKYINDTYGHDAGDKVLIDFARRVARRTRKGDRFFRMGGEEFVLLLPGTDTATLMRLCEQLREQIAAELRSHGEQITVSIGAAALADGEDASSWLGRADEAMYEAKNQGRNRVVVHPGCEPDA